MSKKRRGKKAEQKRIGKERWRKGKMRNRERREKLLKTLTRR